MADAMGVVGDAIGVSLVPGGEQLSRSGVRQARGAALEAQRAGIQGQLQAAAAQGNLGLVDELTDALLELNVTIKENEKAIFDARVAEVNNTRDYNTSIIDLKMQILDLDGTLTGVVDTAAKEALLRERQIEIDTKGQELQALLMEAIASGNTQAVNDLNKAILENTIASKQNTQAINEITGATNAPQTFSSGVWAAFREAVFNGIGGILGQYDVFGASGSVASATGAMGGAGSNTSMSVSSTDNGRTINNTFNINEAGGPIDVTEVAGVVTFAQKTAQ